MRDSSNTLRTAQFEGVSKRAKGPMVQEIPKSNFSPATLKPFLTSCSLVTRPDTVLEFEGDEEATNEF